MNSIVRICGVDYPSCERVQEAAYWGIKTPGKTFWLFPVCDDGGLDVTTLPPFLPREIKIVTNEMPDLTQQYPETVKERFDLRRAYYDKTTNFKQFMSDNPNLCDPPTEEEFTEGRKCILAASLEDFTRSDEARSAVWWKHGTRELADQHGYIGAFPENVIKADGLPNLVWSENIAEMLRLKLMEKHGWSASSRTGWAAAGAILNKLKYVMIYDGVPAQQLIYLEEMKVAANPLSIRSSESVLTNDPRTQNEQAALPSLPWLDLDRADKLMRRQEKLAADDRNRIAQKKKLVAAENKLESERRRRQKEDTQLAQEHNKQPVTPAMVCEALGVGRRQVRNILAKHELEWPQNRRQLDVLVEKHQRRKKALAEALKKRNLARANNRRGEPESDDDDFLKKSLDP